MQKMRVWAMKTSLYKRKRPRKRPFDIFYEYDLTALFNPRAGKLFFDLSQNKVHLIE